jgi:cytoskeletal protein CcmA (bactofilin family)
MFSSSKNTSVSTNKIDTLIGAATNMSGNINTTGVIRIDGKYSGDIFTESDVIIGEGAFIKGNIIALNISIAGNVEGNIKSNGTLEILPTGTLIGDVEVVFFSIDKGATFNGMCVMISQDVKKLSVGNE